MITPEPGVVIAGRYALERPLARGGMGSIWIARHRDLEIDVTVKFMAPSLVESVPMRTRFEREAKVAARLRSQHIVQVHDYGVEDGTPYMVMELLEGESLADRLKREGRLPIPITARLLVQICKALRTAHEAGLVHRDLKPANIFLAHKDGEEVVKILDFGIVKTRDGAGDAQSDTATGIVLGSVHYMSPEQVRSSRQVDHRSDLWSLAVILYRVVTGSLPFPGSNTGDVMVRICTDVVPPPSSIAPGLPAQIDAFFQRAFVRDEAQRFQSAQEMAEAFIAIATSAPLAATRPAPQKTVPLPPPLITTGAEAHGAPHAAMGQTPWPQQQSQQSMPSSSGNPPIMAPPSSSTGPGLSAAVLLPSNPSMHAPLATELAAKPRALWPVWIAVAVSVLGGITIGAILLGRSSDDQSDDSAAGSVSALPSAPATSVSAAPQEPAAQPTVRPDAPAVTTAASSAQTGASAAPTATSTAGSAPTAAPKAPSRPTYNPLDRPD